MAMNRRVSIRAARPGDGPGLAELHLDISRYYVDLAPDGFQMPDSEGLAEHFDPKPDPPDHRIWLVAEAEGEIVAAVIAHMQPSSPAARWAQPWLGDPSVYVDYLAVLGKWQRRGIARRLVDVADRWALGQGAVRVITDTYLDSPLSVPFWTTGQGYRQRGILLPKVIGSDP